MNIDWSFQDPPGPLLANLILSALREAGAVHDTVQIRRLEIAPMRSGLVGNVRRLKVLYTEQDAVGPSSIIVKSPSAAFESGKLMQLTETLFYRERVGERSGISMPAAYYSDVNDSSKESVLILQDLGDKGTVTQADGCSWDNALAAVHAAAVMHSRWWGIKPSPDLTWVDNYRDSHPLAEFYKHLKAFDGVWPELLGPLPGVLIKKKSGLTDALANIASTLVHGDFHSENMKFLPSNRSSRPYLLDFQFVHFAPGAVDLARFFATSLTVESRRRFEGPLLKYYFDELRSNGVFVDEEEQIRALKLGFIVNLYAPLAIHVTKIMRDDGDWPPSLPIIQKCITAIIDWDALAAL